MAKIEAANVCVMLNPLKPTVAIWLAIYQS